MSDEFLNFLLLVGALLLIVHRERVWDFVTYPLRYLFVIRPRKRRYRRERERAEREWQAQRQRERQRQRQEAMERQRQLDEIRRYLNDL
jgi:hypothetical protein